MKVHVDPACNINYSSFYIKGLWDIFGKENICFASYPFKKLRYGTNTHCLAFYIDGKKYVIDYADSNAVFYEPFLDWADVYGKVNFNQKLLPDKWKTKIMRVGPNFGVGYFGNNKWESLFNCLKFYRKAYRRLDMSFGSFLSPYLWLYKRSGITNAPVESVVGSRSIFMISRFWTGEDETNMYRINFIRACRRLQSEGKIEFSGGMVPSMEEDDCPEDVELRQEVPMLEYIKLMKKSLIVFNTPAVHKCHGWKLPEYLSQGKIILSTPFVNELPTDMSHGENIYFTQPTEEAIYSAVKAIVEDRDLQKRLETGSREFWEKHISPKSCIDHFING